jgi:hypothetical protein
MKTSVTLPLTSVTISVTFQRIKARSVKDAFREGIPEVGASAVPAGGLTNRSRAASGIS